jgi:hypothetical protein
MYSMNLVLMSINSQTCLIKLLNPPYVDRLVLSKVGEIGTLAVIHIPYNDGVKLHRMQVLTAYWKLPWWRQ